MSRRALLITAVGAAAVLAVGAIAGGWWYHQKTATREVRGSSTVEFQPHDRPAGSRRPPRLVQTVPWPTFGYDLQRTHLSPFNHRPPFRRLWVLKTGWYVEFPPAVGYGKVFVSQLRGRFFAVDAKTGVWRWKREFPYCSAASPTLTRGLVIETFVPAPSRRARGTAPAS